MEIPDLLSDGGFRLNALIMVRLFAKDLRGYWERISQRARSGNPRLGL
jgi:hypothetical protein